MSSVGQLYRPCYNLVKPVPHQLQNTRDTRSRTYQKHIKIFLNPPHHSTRSLGGLPERRGSGGMAHGSKLSCPCRIQHRLFCTRTPPPATLIRATSSSTTPARWRFKPRPVACYTTFPTSPYSPWIWKRVHSTSSGLWKHIYATTDRVEKVKTT